MNDQVHAATDEIAANDLCALWVEAHGDYLFNFALGQLRDASLAEDLVQDTFLAALKSQTSFCGKSSERTWLTGIMRHKICDYLRKACRERAVMSAPGPARSDNDSWDETLVWLHEVAGECVSPSRRMELAEFRANLEQALGTLPPRVAAVFQLYEIEDRSNGEVCERLNITESNLWVMLHRARKHLREQLSDWYHGDRHSRSLMS